MTEEDGFKIEFALDCGFRPIDNEDISDPLLQAFDPLYLAKERDVLELINRMGWQPIKTAPKDRPIDLWVDGERQINCEWNSYFSRWSWKEWRGGNTNKHRVSVLTLKKPTHWRETPGEPKP